MTSSVPQVAELGRVHFVGIGGAGMSGIARIMRARGCLVSGSDAKESRALDALRALGVEIWVGHDPSHITDADTVVVSTAIKSTNVELMAAHAEGLRVLRRAEALAALMLDRVGVAVAGTHGKTTTTSMLTVALQHCGVDPSFAIGGDLNESGSNAHDGSGEIFVAEADESDGSFLLLSPLVSIVTNVEPDHVDHYGDPAAFVEAFDAFVERLPDAGILVACADDVGSRELASRSQSLGVDVRTYGTGPDADLVVSGIELRGRGSTSELVLRGIRVGTLDLAVPGLHNVLNACAALMAGLALGMPAVSLLEGLAGYSGTRRRFEPKGTARGIAVFDDYAHHPTEIAATVAAAREVNAGGRVVVVFQPHRYSRTAAFLDDFAEALSAADEVVVMEVYAAGEDPLPGAGGAAVARGVSLPADRVEFVPSWSEVPQAVAARLREGDLLLTMGAGDVTLIGPEVLELLRAPSGGAP